MIDPKDILHIERVVKDHENTYSVYYILKYEKNAILGNKYNVTKEDIFGNRVDVKEVDERAKQYFMDNIDIIDVKYDNSIEFPFNK
jgi:hypothetical protein